MFTYASRDEHGQHYRSCATEWGWREDENRPPYKRPKAIVQANPKAQLYCQPTFHTERKPVAGIIWRGTRGPRRAREPHHNRPQELGEQKGSCSHMPPGTSMANITAHALPSGDGEKMKIGHPKNDPRPSFRRTRKHNSIANPPFTRKENLSLVSSGGAQGGPIRAREPHHNNPYSLERRRGVAHICLPGRAWPTLPLMRYRVGMERR